MCIRDRYYTDRKDSAVFWYEYDGVGYNGAWSPVDSHLGDWSGYLRIWYDESTGAIKGTSIDETHTLLTAGQFDETREVGYVTIQFYSKSNYNYKSVYIDTISLTTSDEMCQDHEVYEVGVADDRPTYMSESSLMVPATTSIITLQQTQTQEATRRLLGHDIQFGFQLSSGAATYAKAIIEYQLTSGERVVEEGHEVYMQSDTYSEWRSVVVSCYIPDSGVESLCLSMVVEPTTGGLCYVDQPKVAITGTQSAICTYYNDIFMTQWDGWDIGEVGLTTMLWSSEDISSETESLTRIGVGVSSKVIMRDGYPILDQWMITAIEIVAELLPNDGSSTEQYSDLDITSYSCYSKNTVEVYNPQEIDEIAERDSILVGASMGVLTDVVVTGICIAGGITGGTAIAVGIIGGFVGDLVVGYIQNMCSTDYYDNNARGPGTNYRSRVLWDWPHKFMLEDYRVHEAGAGLLMDWKSHKDPLGETDFPNLQLKISATVTFGYHAEIDNILGSITLERIIDLNDRGI